jgi:Cd2+/Zn2+-exporting ATPase
MNKNHQELVWSAAAGALLAAAFLGERVLGLPTAVSTSLYALSYFFGGYDLLANLLRGALQRRFAFDIDLLMLLAAAGAAALGEFAEGAFLLFLFSLAHALEHYALGRARNAIKALAQLAPSMARVLLDGRETEVPVESVKVGDFVVARPGERIAVDGRVRRGRSAVDQAPVTGESTPVDKEPGDDVFAGTVNGEGALEIETTRAVGDRTLDRVVKLVEEAQTQKAPTQEFTDRFERVFVPAVLVADVLLVVLPPLMGWWPWSLAFYRGMSLLVAASPCALALGTPATVLAAITQAARNGVLVKGGAHLERLAGVRAIAFDKTGTLTVGRPEVTDVVPMPGVDAVALLRVAAAVERRSQHPLAQAVVRRAAAEGLDLPGAGDLESVTARGVRSVVEGRLVEIGSLKMWNVNDVPDGIRRAVATMQESGRSIMVVRHGDRFLGAIGLADEPRANASAVMERLRRTGIERLVMLTGDHRGVGDAIGRRVGVDEVLADLLPEDKVDAMRALLRRYERVAMVGDGVNDAPALALATVGVAMGGSGTAVALETADVALMGDDLAKLPFAVSLSRRAGRVIRQNVFIALGVIVFLVAASTTGIFGIGLTVVVHEGSTLVVIANALRLLNVADEPAAL